MAAMIGLTCGSVAVGVVADQAGASNVIYVAPTGNDSGSGESASPVQTIEQAVKLADSGDTIQIADGVYHESVQVYSKEVHLVGAPGAEAVLDGARRVENWSVATGGWSAQWSTDFERVEAPFTTPDRPEAGWPEQFFLDGTPLEEVASLDQLGGGKFFYDKSSGAVVISDDPNGRLVEGSALSWGLYLNKADGSSVSGITVRRYATQNRNMAAIRAYSNDLSIIDTTVELNARIGLSVIGDRIDLRDVRATDNGHLGVHGHRSSDVTMTDLVVTGNNRERFDAKHSAGGIKVTDSTRLIVDSTVASDNAGPGIWTDLDVTDSMVVSSVAERNGRSGIEIELSNDILIFDNTVVDNGEAGVWVLESSNVDVWHNTALHNVRDIWVLDGDRADLVGATVVNNVLGGGAEGAQALLNADDWTERRSASDMQVEIASNRFWIHPDSPTQLVSRWANWPQSLSLSGDVGAHQTATGQGAGSDLIVSGSNPFSRSATDVGQPATAPVGRTLPADIEELVGMSGAHPSGIIATSDSDGTNTTTTGTSTDTNDQPVTETDPDGADDDEPGTTGTTGTTSTQVSTGGAGAAPTPGETPDGAASARIGRSDQAVPAANPDTANPVAPVNGVDASTSSIEAAEFIDIAELDTAEADVEQTSPSAAQTLRRSGWGALHDQVRRALVEAES